MKASKTLGAAIGLGLGLMLLGQDLSANQAAIFPRRLQKGIWA